MSEVGRMVDWNPTVTSGSIIGGKEWNSVFFHGSGAPEIQNGEEQTLWHRNGVAAVHAAGNLQ